LLRSIATGVVCPDFRRLDYLRIMQIARMRILKNKSCAIFIYEKKAKGYWQRIDYLRYP
jgi:hypothetical protein